MSLAKHRSGMREVSNDYLIWKLLDAATLTGFVFAVMAMNSIGRNCACLRPEISCSRYMKQCSPLRLVGKAKANFTQRPGPTLSMCNSFQLPKEHSQDQHTLQGKPCSVHLPFVLLCCCENRSFLVDLIAFLWDFGTSQGVDFLRNDGCGL